MPISTTHLFADEFLSVSPNILINCDIDDWSIDYISDNILQFGYDSKVLINEKWSFKDIIHPDDCQRVQDEVMKCIVEGHDSFLLNYRILSKSKVVHWVEEQKVIKRDQDNEVTHSLGLISDITHRKLNNSQVDFFKQFIEISNDAVYVVDYESSDFIEINQNACEMLGYSKKKLLTQSLVAISQIINNKKHWNELVIRTEKVRNSAIIEDVHFHKNGDEIPVEISLKEQGYDGGKVFIVTARNISKRKQAEKALQEEREFLQNIIDGIADPLVVIDTDYNVILSNQAQTEYKPVESSDKETQKCYQIAHGRQTPCDQFKSPCSLYEVLKAQQPVSYIRQYQTDNEHGTHDSHTHEFIASPLRDNDGNIKAIIEINHDISDLMKTKQQLEDKEKKLNQLIQGRAEMVNLITQLVVGFISATKENMDDLINDGLSLIGQLTQVDRCCLFSFDFNLATTSNTHEWCRKQEHSKQNVLQDISAKAYKCIYKQLKSGKPIYVPDVENIDPKLEPVKQEFLNQDVKSVLIVPMHMNGQLDGVLGFVSVDRVKYWSDEDVNLLLLLGQIITETSIRIQTEIDLHHSQTVMKSILDTMDAMVYVCDQNNHELLFVNKQVKEMIGENIKFICLEGDKSMDDIKSGLCDFCTNQKHPFEFNPESKSKLNSEPNSDLKHEKKSSNFQEWDFQSKMNDHWYHCRAKNFSWIDGRQVRLAVTTDISERINSEQTNKKLFDENSQLIHEILKSTENERKYLARELHDEMGQLITAIRLEADFLKQECINHSYDVVSSINEIKIISSDVLKSIRNVTNRLRPSSMTHNSIIDTLKELHYNWKKHNRDIVSSFQSVGEVIELQDSISIVLYRVLQECLTNIARHARDTKQVKINLLTGKMNDLSDNIILDTKFTMTNSFMIILTVEDDGNGFDVNTSHHGNGLAGMRERLQSIEGQFQLISEPGIGTKVIASLPIPIQSYVKLLVEDKK